MYKKIKLKDLIKDEKPAWNPVLCKHIANQLHRGTFEYTEEDIKALPEPVQHLHYLWRGQCEISASGFEVFLSQAPAAEIKEIYKALQEVNAKKLKELMGLAIGMAIEDSVGEFISEIEGSDFEEWFSQFEIDGSPYPDLQVLDEEENPAQLAEELDDVIILYIKKHLEEIAE